MGLDVTLDDVVAEQFVEPVTADVAVAEIRDLAQRVARESTQRQIERPAAPVEHQHELVVELGERTTERLLVAEIRVQRGQRFVDELDDPHPRLQRSVAELAPTASVHRHRDRHDRAVEIVATRGRVLPEVAEDSPLRRRSGPRNASDVNDSPRPR